MKFSKMISVFALTLISAGMLQASSPESSQVILPKKTSDPIILQGAGIESQGVGIESQGAGIESQGAGIESHFNLKVYVDHPECCDAALPIQGGTQFSNGQLVFEPDFPWMEGIGYLVKIEGKKDHLSFSIPKKESRSSTLVTEVYPSGSELPENLFRFYFYFSSPMQRGVADQYIQLRDEEGEEIKGVFLNFQIELWSPDRKRLTLILDPGRIKRGVGPNQEVGLALEDGKRYQLWVNPEWPDAAGNALQEGFTKDFQVTAASRSKPNPEKWGVKSPQQHTQDRLELQLNRSFDHALLRRLITVRTLQGEIISGRIELKDSESQWTFVPDFPWQEKEYRIQIETVLEDLAGNNLQAVFDHQAGTTISKNRITQLSFFPRS